MISNDMYKVLKRVPRYPKDTTSSKLLERKTLKVDLLFEILQDAKACKYIMYTERPRRNLYYSLENSPFCLTEAGKIQIEEYKNQKGSSAKATWALIIAGLSFLSSAVAVVVSLVQ